MRMGLSVEKSTKPYTQEAYLNDIEKQLFKETLNGKPLSAPMIAQLSVYISSLKGMCPTLKAIDKAVSTGAASIALNEQTNPKLQALELQTIFTAISATEEQSGMEPMTAVNFYAGTDIEAICYEKLKSARRYLIQAHIMKHIIFFIFVLTATMYTFAQESVSSPIIKGKDNKNLEFFKSNKLQSPISPTSIFGQEIRGVVYDKKTNEVLIGASVIEVGSSNGTITDIDGQFLEEDQVTISNK